MEEDNYKFYKVTYSSTNHYSFGVLNTKTNIFYYPCLTTYFDRAKLLLSNSTFEEVPRIVVENDKKQRILAQMNELRQRKENVDLESAESLIHLNHHV